MTKVYGIKENEIFSELLARLSTIAAKLVINCLNGLNVPNTAIYTILLIIPYLLRDPLFSSMRNVTNLANDSTSKTIDCRLRVNDECVPIRDTEGLGQLGLLFLIQRCHIILAQSIFQKPNKLLSKPISLAWLF